MDGLLLMLIDQSWIHVLVMTFLSELKVFVSVRDEIMNQAINSILTLSQNLQKHSAKLTCYSNIYKTSLQESAKLFSKGESAT